MRRSSRSGKGKKAGSSEVGEEKPPDSSLDEEELEIREEGGGLAARMPARCGPRTIGNVYESWLYMQKYTVRCKSQEDCLVQISCASVLGSQSGFLYISVLSSYKCMWYLEIFRTFFWEVGSSHTVSLNSDVNTVTFADESGNLLYSGSDDNLCKVWDRRCLVREKPAGVLTGHLDGITCIDSRGDGRYLISNCKDQTIKLWDVRRMSATVKGRQPRLYDWDYRWMSFPSHARYYKHPNDLSLATYRGHSVLRTLIRCYFSPMHSTGQRYIYTGSSDDSVHIYDVHAYFSVCRFLLSTTDLLLVQVTGATVKKLSWHGSIIRDCTWHPYRPTLVSSSWDGYLARWEASGDNEDPSVLTCDEQRTSPYDQTYGLSFALY
uniref:Uncharacterized protein n=1 Tax=Aegilops tauschii TaxID=37682 RepID=R7WFJ4_AEGTA